MIEKAGPTEACGAGMRANGGIAEAFHVIGTYHMECHSKDGALKWADDFPNIVTTAGKNKLLDATLKTGLTLPAWYVGLVTGPGSGNTYAAGDVMSSHSGWAENVTYSEGTRQALTLGSISAGSVDNSASKAVFTLNGSATIGGAFLCDVSTKSGTTGTLYSVGSNTNGDKAGGSADTITVTYTATIT